MRRSSAIAVIFWLFATGFTYAAELDNYYLEQFGESVPSSAKAVIKSASPPKAQKCGMPIRRELRRDWKKLESGTQKTLAKYLAKPVLTNEATQTSSGGHFIIHYATTGSDLPTPVAPYTVASWVQQVANTFEDVYTKEVTSMGYSAPGTPYHVYLQQLASQSAFGFTDPNVDSNNNVILTGQSASSYITIDNDFVDQIFQSNIPGSETPAVKSLKALEITAAHEFHHAIQFFYNYFFESWYAEATSTWMEDEAYDSVNQLYSYSSDYLLAPSESFNTPADGGYSRWIFNRLLAENHTGTSIRLIWDKLRTTSANGSDIPMIPVINSSLNDQASSFSNEFSLFAKRLYKQDWTSHTNELSLLYAVPLTINATYANFPVNSASSPQPTATMPAYSIGYFKFLPANSSAPINLRLTLSATAGLNVTALKKTTGNVITEFPLTTNGGTLIIDSFGVPGVAEVTLIICNPTSSATVVNFSTDGTTQPPPSTNSGGGGGGCFIATAAYGSYLHPKVMILREFRDRYLLTNLPGRVLVAAYYRISPPLADLISRHELLRVIVRLLLAPVIFIVEHSWLMLATITLLAGGYTLRRQRKSRLQTCSKAS